MTSLKHFALLSVALAAGAASAATQPLNPVTDSYVTLNTAVLSDNSFTATALGASTYNGTTGKLTDAITSVTTTTSPGALTVNYDNASGLSLRGSLSGLGVTVNMTGFFYDAGTNTLFGDLAVNTLLGNASYANQAILVAGTEVGTLGTNSINSVTTSTTPRDLNYTLSNFTIAADLNTKLGTLAPRFAWLPSAVTSVVAYTKPSAAIPEPSTYALMGLGLVGIAAVSRRRMADNA